MGELTAISGCSYLVFETDTNIPEMEERREKEGEECVCQLHQYEELKIGKGNRKFEQKEEKKMEKTTSILSREGRRSIMSG